MEKWERAKRNTEQALFLAANGPRELASPSEGDRQLSILKFPTTIKPSSDTKIYIDQGSFRFLELHKYTQQLFWKQYDVHCEQPCLSLKDVDGTLTIYSHL